MPQPILRCSVDALLSAQLTLLAVVLGLLPSTVFAESWTDLRGTKTIEARMVGMWDDNIILEMPGGRRVAVKKGSLQAASRIQAETLAAKIEATRDSQIDVIRRRANEASAPAPNPLPKPDPAPEFIPMPADLSPEAARKHAMDQMTAGHLYGGFDSLPPSYRDEFDSISKLAVAKVDAATFDAVVGVLHDIGDTLVTHQRWFKSHPRFEAMGEDSAENVQSLFLSVAGLLRDGFDPKYVSHANLSSQPMSQWLKAFDDRTSPHIAPLMQSFADLDAQAAPVFSEPDKTGAITVSTPNPTNPRQMIKSKLVQVDGYWGPPEMQTWIDDIKKKLDETEDGSVGGGGIAMMISAGIAPVLSPLKNASSESDFHAAMESMLAQAGTAMTGLQAVLPKDFASKLPLPGQSGGGNPYGGDPYGGADPYGGGGGMEDDYAKQMENYGGG